MTNKYCGDDCENCSMYEQCYPNPKRMVKIKLDLGSGEYRNIWAWVKRLRDCYRLANLHFVDRCAYFDKRSRMFHGC